MYNTKNPIPKKIPRRITTIAFQFSGGKKICNIFFKKINFGKNITKLIILVMPDFF